MVGALRPKRRWFQLRLRTLLILVLVLCVPLAWLANRLVRTRPQRDALAELRRHGYGGMQEPLPAERWLIRWIGFANVKQMRSYLRDVRTVKSGGAGDGKLDVLRELPYVRVLALGGDNVTDAAVQHIVTCTEATDISLYHTQVTDAGLQQLRPLRKLQRIYLAYSGITDAGLDVLEVFPELLGLDLTGTRITDAGLAKLQRLPRLRGLTLAKTAITDDGLAYLGHLTCLDFLVLRETRVTPEGLAKLQKALPKCRMYQDGKLFVLPASDRQR